MVLLKGQYFCSPYFTDEDPREEVTGPESQFLCDNAGIQLQALSLPRAAKLWSATSLHCATPLYLLALVQCLEEEEILMGYFHSPWPLGPSLQVQS